MSWNRGELMDQETFDRYVANIKEVEDLNTVENDNRAVFKHKGDYYSLYSYSIIRGIDDYEGDYAKIEPGKTFVFNNRVFQKIGESGLRTYRDTFCIPTPKTRTISDIKDESLREDIEFSEIGATFENKGRLYSKKDKNTIVSISADEVEGDREGYLNIDVASTDAKVACQQRKPAEIAIDERTLKMAGSGIEDPLFTFRNRLREIADRSDSNKDLFSQLKDVRDEIETMMLETYARTVCIGYAKEAECDPIDRISTILASCQ